MELNIMILPATIVFAAVVIILVYDWYRRNYCRYCGSKMDTFYDVEEDAVVYQCPNCGRHYLYD